jgi:hypothetical protein
MNLACPPADAKSPTKLKFAEYKPPGASATALRPSHSPPGTRRRASAKAAGLPVAAGRPAGRLSKSIFGSTGFRLSDADASVRPTGRGGGSHGLLLAVGCDSAKAPASLRLLLVP